MEAIFMLLESIFPQGSSFCALNVSYAVTAALLREYVAAALHRSAAQYSFKDLFFVIEEYFELPKSLKDHFGETPSCITLMNCINGTEKLDSGAYEDGLIMFRRLQVMLSTIRLLRLMEKGSCS